MSEKGMKFDDNKLLYHLIPLKALEEEIKVLMIGAAKYEENNWQKVDNAIRRYLNATLRHLGKIVEALNNGWSDEKIAEMKDEDSGLHPLAHCACDIHFLLGHLEKYGKFDNETWKEKIKKIREEYKNEREKFGK